MEQKKDREVDIRAISRKTLSKQVIDEIIDLLVTGQLEPGDRLPSELELMEICDVSRPVIREALTSLEVMGIIHRKTRKGSFFAERIGSKPFSMMLALAAGDIQSIIEIRVALELGLVTLAAEKITDKDLQKLKEINERMKKLPTQDSTKEDKEFHKIIAMSANNPLFAGVITPLQQFHEKILGKISLKDRDLEETLRQHTLIYEALERRDPVAAYTAMYNHLNYARKKALKSIELKQQ